MATREVSVDKKVDGWMTRMTRRLYVLVMSHMRFRVNLHSVVA